MHARANSNGFIKKPTIHNRLLFDVKENFFNIFEKMGSNEKKISGDQANDAILFKTPIILPNNDCRNDAGFAFNEGTFCVVCDDDSGIDASLASNEGKFFVVLDIFDGVFALLGSKKDTFVGVFDHSDCVWDDFDGINAVFISNHGTHTGGKTPFH